MRLAVAKSKEVELVGHKSGFDWLLGTGNSSGLVNENETVATF